MPQIGEHLKWCLKDPRRLIKTNPDLDLAQKHVRKSEYDYGVVQTLEKLKIYDWALNVSFYAIYHCLPNTATNPEINPAQSPSF